LYDAGVRLPLVVYSPEQPARGNTSDAMASWVDLAPTILEWAGAKADGLPGRSLLPLLDGKKPASGRDVVFGSHIQHEVTMYYPMRSIRTRTHKYILNLAHDLEFPTAGDLYRSPTWQTVLTRRDNMLGGRELAAYLRRPREELYDLEKDPDELKNVGADGAYANVLADLRNRLKDWQKKTNDPWLVKYEHE
jgi:N-sulfoglucosamine sulfohydrolase